MATGELTFLVKVDSATGQAALSKFGDTAKGAGDKGKTAADAFGASLSSISTIAAGLGITFGAMAIGQKIQEFADKALDFEKAWMRVEVILRDTPHAEVETLKQKILDLDPALGTAKSLTDAMYQAISSGVTEPKAALELVKSAAVAAAGGFTDVETTLKSGAATMNAYGLESKDMNHIFDVMAKAVDLGVIEFKDLATQMGQVTPIAAANNVGFDELSAAVASLTLNGVTASEAVTQVRSVMVSLVGPSEEAKKVADKLGIAWDANALSTKGLSGVLQQLTDTTGVTKEDLHKLVGRVEGLNGVMGLTSDHGAKQFHEVFDKIKKASDGAGASLESFNKQQDTVAGALQTSERAMTKLAEAVGDKLAPYLKDAAKLMLAMTDTLKTGEVPINSATVALVAFAAALTTLALAKVTTELISMGSGFAALGILKYVTDFNSLRTAVNLLGTSVGLTTAALGTFGTAIAVAGAAFVGWKIGTFINDVTGLSDVLADQFTLLGVGSQAWKDAKESMDLTNKKMAEVLKTSDPLNAALDRSGLSTSEWNRQLAAALAPLSDMKTATKNAGAEQTLWNQILKDADIADKAHAEAINKSREAVKAHAAEIKSAVETLNSALNPTTDLTARIKLLEQGHISGRDIIKYYHGELATATKTAEDNGKAVDPLVNKYQLLSKAIDLAAASAKDGVDKAWIPMNKEYVHFGVVVDSLNLSLPINTKNLTTLGLTITGLNADQAKLNTILEEFGVTTEASTAKFLKGMNEDYDAMQRMKEQGIVTTNDVAAVFVSMVDKILSKTGTLEPDMGKQLAVIVQTTKGKLNDEALSVWNKYIEDIKDKYGKLPLDIEETNNQIQEAAKKGAKDTSDAWSKEISTITNDWIKGLSDILVEGGNFKDKMVDIAKETGKSFLRSMLDDLLSPLKKQITEWLDDHVKLWIDKFKKIGTGILDKIGSLFGVGGGVVGAIAAGVVLIVAEWDKIKKGWDDIWAKTPEGVKTALRWLSPLAAAVSAIVKTTEEKISWEFPRDFGGVEITTKQVQDFAKELGLTSKALDKIRLDVSSSPKFMQEIGVPAADTAGKLDALYESMSHVKTSWGTFDFSKSLKFAVETGDWSKLNAEWVAAFKNSKALVEVIPDFDTKLAALNTTTTGTAGEFQALYLKWDQAKPVTKDLTDYVAAHRAELDLLKLTLPEVGTELDKINAALKQEAIDLKLADLKTFMDDMKATNVISEEFSKFITDNGGDLKAFQASLESVDLQKMSDGFTSIKDSLVLLDPVQEDAYAAFVKTGVVTTELSDKITKAGGDIDKFKTYADMKKVSESFDTMKKAWEATQDILPGLRQDFIDFGGDIAALDAAAQLPNMRKSLDLIDDFSSGLDKLLNTGSGLSEMDQFLKEGVFTQKLQDELSAAGALTDANRKKFIDLADTIKYRKDFETMKKDYEKTGKIGSELEQLLYKSGMRDWVITGVVTAADFDKMKGKLDDTFKTVGAELRDILKAAGKDLSNSMDKIVTDMDASMLKVGKSIKDTFEKSRKDVIVELDKIIDSLDLSMKGLTDKLDKANEDLKNRIKGLVPAAGGAVTDINAEFAKLTTPDIGQTLIDSWKKALDYIKDNPLKTTSSAGRNAFANLIESGSDTTKIDPGKRHDLGDEYKSQIDALEKVRTSFTKLGDAIRLLNPSLKLTVGTLDDAIKAFLKTGEVSDLLKDKVKGAGGEIEKFTAFSRIDKMKTDFADLRIEFEKTGIVTDKLTDIMKKYGGDIAALTDYSAVSGMKELRTEVKAFRDELMPATPANKTDLEKFKATGEITAKLAADIAKYGADLGVFQTYANAKNAKADLAGLVSNFKSTGFLSDDLKRLQTKYGGLSASDTITQGNVDAIAAKMTDNIDIIYRNSKESLAAELGKLDSSITKEIDRLTKAMTAALDKVEQTIKDEWLIATNDLLGELDKIDAHLVTDIAKLNGALDKVNGSLSDILTDSQKTNIILNHSFDAAFEFYSRALPLLVSQSGTLQNIFGLFTSDKSDTGGGPPRFMRGATDPSVTVIVEGPVYGIDDLDRKLSESVQRTYRRGGLRFLGATA